LNNKTQIKNLYLKSAIFFIPVFIIFYGVNPYGINTIFLYNNPFGTLTTEQWLQESPIQFFLGYFLNIFLGNEQSTFNFVNIIGFIFLYFSLYSYDSKNLENVPIIKILYFTPLFLILFYWMGKPDTFTIGSLFLLISYKDKIATSFVAIFIMIFSHIYVTAIYMFITILFKFITLRWHHYLSLLINLFFYILYRMEIDEINGRFDVISSEIERALYSSFTNLLSGIISLFMWIWIPLLLSKSFKDKKFLLSFILIMSISFFTLDHTRIFILSSVPLIIYLSKSRIFNEKFNLVFSNNWIYLIGLFQIQKRGGGKIVDGWSILEIDIFKSTLDKFIYFLNNIVGIF